MVDKEESVEEKPSLFICTKCDFKKKKKKKKKKEKNYDFLHFTCILFPLFLLIARIYGRLVVWSFLKIPQPLKSGKNAYCGYCKGHVIIKPPCIKIFFQSVTYLYLFQ